jgi:hypothetical protein
MPISGLPGGWLRLTFFLSMGIVRTASEIMYWPARLDMVIWCFILGEFFIPRGIF